MLNQKVPSQASPQWKCKGGRSTKNAPPPLCKGVGALRKCQLKNSILQTIPVPSNKCRPNSQQDFLSPINFQMRFLWKPQTIYLSILYIFLQVNQVLSPQILIILWIQSTKWYETCSIVSKIWFSRMIECMQHFHMPSEYRIVECKACNVNE